MLLKSIRRMHGLCFEGRCRWTHHFLFVTWLLLITSTPPKALGYFLGDTKAVLNGCEDHWTLQDKATMPLLFEMTLCVDIRVVVPGAWVAFSYSSVHAPRPELGLEGDDEALYGWLLRVRHRFPFRLSPTYWHRLCLRRDVRHNSFSLEVDGKMVAERTVIAQAIPPTGSLWLGCRPRDRPPGAMLGKVELYLFRMWADLDNHGLCEDGTVIGWNAQYWGVTSRRARQIDPNLLCDHRRLRRGAPAKSGVTNAMSTGFGRSFSRPPEMPLTTTTSSPVIATTGIHMHTQSSTVTGSPLVNCDISQLCSDKNAYFWMPIRVEAKDGTKTEGDVKSLVSNAFGCHSDGGDATRGVTGFTDFCQGDRQPQVVQVNCRVKSNISETTCDVLLQLSHAVSACALQRTGDSALQQAGEQIQATIIGEVERVGRDVCRDVEPSSGRFVRCTSSSSLEDICQSNNNSTLTCSLIEPNSDPAPQPMTESCSSEAPRFCDCMAFCNSARQFFALRININSASVNIHFLKGLLSGFRAAHICDTILGSACQDILRRYQRFHLECHGTKQRLYSCMVILEMSGPVNACFLNKLLQKVIDSNSGITNERPLTRMVVCGPPGLTVRTLLASNLTWVASDLLISDVCQPDPTLLKCEANERLAVLLTDSCPPEPSTTGQSTAQPSSLTKTTTTEALTRSVANALLQTNTTAEITATVEQRNASQETAQLITTTPLTTINSTQSSTPVLHTSSQNITVTVSDSAPVQNTTLSNNTTLLRHTENTKVQNKTTAHQKTTVFTRSYSVNSTLQITTTAPTDSTLNKTTLSRLHTTVYNVTTVDTVKPSANHTTEYNLTTVHRVTPSANHITEYNVTVDTLTPSVNLTTAYNVTTGIPSYNQTTEYNVTVNTVTPSTTHTTEYNTTTVETVTLSANLTTEYNITAVDTVTPSTTHTVGYNITKLETVTPSDNLTKAYNVTSGTPSYNHATDFNTISISTVTPSTNQITEYNVTVDTVTHSANHTIEYNVTTVDTVTPSTNHTVEYNVTVEAVTPSANLTSAYNITTADTVTPSTNHTTAYNETSVTPSNNHTTVYNVTKAGSDRKNDNSTFTTTNTTVSTITTSPNHTKVNNVTTATNNHTTGNSTVPNNYRTADTTVPNNYTTVNTIGPYNYTTVNTTVPNNYTTGNSTVPNNYRTVDTTVRNNYTTVNTTVATNHTTVNNTVPNNYTTVNTTVPNNYTSVNTTVATNHTTVNTTVPNNYTTVNTTVANNRTTVNTTVPNNHTTVNTTVSNNYTTVNNVSTVPNNYTTVNKVTTVSNNNKTVENITTPTESQNETATDNVTTAPIKESQQNTTAPSKNMTASTTVIQVTPNNTTTSTRNSTVVNVTFVVENTTKHTMAPLKNHTGNPTTARLTHNISTTKNNNITKAATVVSTTIDLTHTAGLTSNLSSTARSLTTDFNLTTKRPNNLRTPAASIEGTTSTTATTTIHGSLPATTFAKVSLTSSTTTTSLTTTTKPDSATPSTTFTETTTSQEALEEQANELLNQTQDMSQLNSSQVAELVGELEKLLDGPSVSQALGKKLFNVISNLMEGDSQILSASANRLVQLVDDLGLKLVVTGDREILSSGSLVLAVRNVDGTNFPTTSVDILNTDNVQLRALRRSRFKRSGSPLGSVFLPSSLTTGLSPEQQKQASRVQFTFYTKSVFFQDVALDNETRVGPVLAASVANLSISNLSENIHFTIRNIKPKHANASCAFWDFTQNGGRGGWSSAGCFVVNATAEETICSCNHLTSFAILLDLSREENIDPRHAQILTFITYIGCGISAIFLAVTLLTYLSFEKLLRDIPAKILVQLCLSLLLLNLVFLVDGWLALYPAVGLCISTAFFLHYFMLTSFTWAGLEALHMYLSIVRVFTPYLSRYMLKFSLIGWGVPLLVVIIVISVDKDNYGLVTYGRNTDGTSDDFCWLRNDIAFYVGVVAYFLLIFSLCLLVFIVVMVQLSRIKKQNPQNQPPNRGVITDLRSIAGLVILLGLTWGFALFAWGPLYLPFVYLFSIFNSLQGFFVFVFHCAVKENVRRQWRTYLCCGKLRLAENSEWSRTATQNNRNMSVATATTSATASAPHFTSRSSSVISDATNSSGSVFMDSGISDGTNSDTVLNDIHRRNLSL